MKKTKRPRGPDGKFLKREPVVMPPAPAELPEWMLTDPPPVGPCSSLTNRTQPKKSLLSRLLSSLRKGH